MEKIKIPEDYISLTYAKDFHSLCQPLLSNTDIASCYYIRLYQNGDYFHLSSDPVLDDLMLFKYGGKYHFDVSIIDTLYSHTLFTKDKNKLCVYAEDIDSNKYWAPLFKEYSITNNLNIIEKFDDYYEIFWFVSRFNKTIHSLCINHYNLLEKFTLYFKENGSNIIAFGEKNKISWSNNNPEYHKIITNLKNNSNKENNNITKLRDSFSLKKYSIIHSSCRLTSREQECLQYLGQGFTYKEIGNRLQISNRTVETHINHIKTKHDVHSIDQLLKIYHANRF